MVYQPDIVPVSATGQALQASIQKELAQRDWSSEEDSVMAEYCLVMLGNKKTPDQINSELSDLIGSDFDTSFTTWLFQELAVHYPDPSAPAASSSSAPGEPISVSSDSRRSPEYEGGRRGGFDDRGRRLSASAGSAGQPPRGPRDAGRRGGPNIFSNAMSGVKRDARDMEGGSGGREQPPHQRARYERPAGFDGVPNGPRNMGNGRGGQQQEGKSIFDRVNAGGQQGARFDRGSGGGGNDFQPPMPTGNFPPGFTPQMMAQAQATAMAQAFAAMQWAAAQQNGGVVPPGFGPPGGFSGGPPGAGGFGGAPGFPGGPNQRQGGPNQPFQQQQPFSNNNQQKRPQQNGHFPGGPGRPNAGAPQNQNQQQQHQNATIPTKPLEEQICKHGVDCTRPTCPYSHPSPVATKDSGLVLSSEPCEKQLNCEDADCPKSHISASAKKAAASTSTSASSAPPAPTPAAAPPAAARPPAVDPNMIAGAGEKPCKFAGACTRPGCVFLHPWDVRGGDMGGVPCRWGDACTRADCHFSHPPSRRFGKPAVSAPIRSAKSYSMTFNNPKNPAIGAWPAEDKAHVSDRLKRFNPEAAAGEESGEAVERIIPGGTEEKKVEIALGGEEKPANVAA
ncbi:hypothetical protein T439DRAFT_321320 [Meredithblackwellia eburnea MCA 4105]